jgi:hypothetical protein
MSLASNTDNTFANEDRLDVLHHVIGILAHLHLQEIARSGRSQVVDVVL